ncbi:hypothetical protein [Sutcliffiella horikoshii]|uniref:hypothetical protein n=1 Tax=Sutcliffiella horikoshii TaxID=79883 RepID=UPI003CE875CC
MKDWEAAFSVKTGHSFVINKNINMVEVFYGFSQQLLNLLFSRSNKKDFVS